MIKTLLTLILLCGAAHAQPGVSMLIASKAASAGGTVAIDQNSLISYAASGGNSVTLTSVSANSCWLFVWDDGGGITSPLCGGHSMTSVVTHVFSTFAGNVTIYKYTGTLSGSVVVTYGAGAGSEGWTFTAANSNAIQPDAVAAYISGTTDGSGNGTLPVTTVANNSLVVGVFGVGHNFDTTPTSNGTWIAKDAFNSLHFWRSTTNVTPAGSFSLVGNDPVPGLTYEALGVSIAP